MADDGFNLGILTRLGVSERSFAAGQTIFHEGDTAEELFVIRKGRVDIRSGERLLNQLGENDLFGEMALVDKAPRSATAIAVTDVDLAPVGEKQFSTLSTKLPISRSRSCGFWRAGCGRRTAPADPRRVRALARTTAGPSRNR